MKDGGMLVSSKDTKRDQWVGGRENSKLGPELSSSSGCFAFNEERVEVDLKRWTGKLDCEWKGLMVVGKNEGVVNRMATVMVRLFVKNERRKGCGGA